MKPVPVSYAEDYRILFFPADKNFLTNCPIRFFLPILLHKQAEKLCFSTKVYGCAAILSKNFRFFWKNVPLNVANVVVRILNVVNLADIIQFQ